MSKADPQERGEVELIARGEISREGLEFIQHQLGRQGLSTEVAKFDTGEPEYPPLPLEIPYTLDGLRTRDQFVVREHMSEFRERFAPGFSENVARRVFGIIGGSSQVRYRTRPNPPPEELGLRVSERHEVGIPKSPGPQEIDAAVELGSLLDFDGNISRLDHVSLQMEYFLRLFTDKVREQLEQPESEHSVNINRGPYSLSDITTEDHFLVREHLWEFREQFASEFTKQDAGRAFSIVLHPQTGGHLNRSRSSIDPAERGLIIRERKEIGFPAAPPTTFNREAVQVGSFLRFLENTPLHTLYGYTPKRGDFLDRLASHLTQKISR